MSCITTMLRVNLKRVASSLRKSGLACPREQRRGIRVFPPHTAEVAGRTAEFAGRSVLPYNTNKSCLPANVDRGLLPVATLRNTYACKPGRSEGNRSAFSTAVDTSASALLGPRPQSWWTGCRPEEAPGVLPNGRISSLPQLMLKGCTKQALQDYFDNTWILTESLFAGLQGEEAFMCPPPHGLRHPLIFYYGHVAALYVNKLRAAGILQGPVNAYFEALLETGVDEMAWDDVGDDNMVWPSVREVHAYRCQVYNLVCEVIASAPDHAIANIGMDSPYWALPMAFEHERIHVETSSVLIRELPMEYVALPATWPDVHPSCFGGPNSALENGLINVEAATVTLGKPKEFPSYGWDNEYGSREVAVPAFDATKHMVSNGEFMEFVKDAGYARRELWSESGWGWKMFRNVKCPKFWIPEGPSGVHEYRLRTVFAEVALPWSWPVLVNFHEAKAFAAWKTSREEQTMGEPGRVFRLATELEHRLIGGANNGLSGTENPQVVDPVLSNSGQNALDGMANTSISLGSESPVNAFPPNEKGFHDVIGNAWEWSEDHFSALEGFNISPLYEDFSTPCFDGEHHVIMGGSFASSGNLASVFSRFHFRPHFHQHSGFRLVAPEQRQQAEAFVTSCTDAPPPFVGSYPFRTSKEAAKSVQGVLTRQEIADNTVAANVAMHYAVPEIASEDPAVAEGMLYPQRCAQLVLRALEGVRPHDDVTVMEVGCGAGGASFELSKSVGKVVALEANKALVDAASAMARDGRVLVQYPSTRASSVTQEVILDTTADPSRITFKQCDPMCLPAGLAGLDAVLIHSVLDAIPGPNSLLARMGGARGMVRENGGLVVVVSAYDWNDEVTPRGSWLGGYLDGNGNKVSSARGLSKALGADFKLIHKERVPRMRPLGDRAFEYASAEATIWRRD